MKEAENLGLSIRHRTSPPGPWRDAAARYENDDFKLAVGAMLRFVPLGC
jgi:hypothetical protein